MSDNKSIYKQFCEEEKNVPLFLKYKWFDAMYSDEEWSVSVAHKGGNVQGFLPYVVTKKKGFTIITPQFLSPYQGVYFNYPTDQKYANRLGFEKEVINELIEQLPAMNAFKQNFLPQFTNWLPFQWKGYKQTTRYTYIINDLSDKEVIFSNFKDNIRREIRKAEKALVVKEGDDIELMFRMKQDVYEANKEDYPIPLGKLKNVFDYCQQNNCGELLVAKDNDGNIHSILLYVWDNQSAYYLHGVTALGFKTTGSMSLLLWEAIQRSATKTKAFNFEGSMVEPIERYFRAFGGIQTPYFQISKTDSKILKLLKY